MSPCLYRNCLAPDFCAEGKQECHINAAAELGIRADQRRRLTGQGIGRTYERVCIGTVPGTEIPVYEQVEK